MPSDPVPVTMKEIGAPAELTGPVNLGNPSEFTIMALAELVVEINWFKVIAKLSAAAG
jgi:hypothetical protein